MREIPLTRNLVAIVDDADFDRVSSMKWCAQRAGKRFYAASRTGCGHNGKLQLMHRVIAPPPDGCCVDHRNFNTLDNRRANLRVCTPVENSRHVRRKKIAGFKGVRRREQKYEARIMVNRKCISLGRHRTEVEAAAAYDAAATHYFGEFALLNLPLEPQ